VGNTSRDGREQRYCPDLAMGEEIPYRMHSIEVYFVIQFAKTGKKSGNRRWRERVRDSVPEREVTDI